MRRSGGLLLGLAAAMAVVGTSRAAEEPRALGNGPSYEALGKLPVLHAGREKPLDTLAREEVKQIFGRETIKFTDDKGEVVETWGPVAAFFDWSARPECWDDQPFILVEYLPLKRLILADAIRARLSAAADRPGTSAADRDALKKLAAAPEIDAADLNALLRSARVADEDHAALDHFAVALGEAHKWLSPRELEEAKVAVDGQEIAFDKWFRAVAQREHPDEMGTARPAKLSEVEKRAVEVGTRLVHYQAFRDRDGPFGRAAARDAPAVERQGDLAFAAKAIQKGREARRPGADPARARRGQRPGVLLERHPRRRPRDARQGPQVRRAVRRLAPRAVGLGPAGRPAPDEARGARRGRLPGRAGRGVRRRVPRGREGRGGPARPAPRGEGDRPADGRARRWARI